MSSRSEVALQCGANVFEKIRPIYERYECPPDKLYDSGDGSTIAHWTYGILWVETDEFVAELTAALESFEGEEGIENAYKIIEICNNVSDENCNGAGQDWFGDFYSALVIEMPEGITEIKN